MKKSITVLCIISTSILFGSYAWAGWVGPQEVLRGKWGKGSTEFGFESGDTFDRLPGPFYILNNGNIIIRDIVNGSSFPKQINYTMGVKHKYKAIEIIMSHKCLHPVDGISNGTKAKSYNLIEGRFNF